MVGLVVATHGELGQGILSAAEMIIGPVRNARSVSIAKEDSLDDIRAAIEQAIAAVSTDGDGTVIVTDMFGGTPANVSITFLEPGKVEILTGVNLPMVLKFFNCQDDVDLDEVAGILKAYGQQSIALASEYLQR